MSHFYGTLKGTRGEATRCGTKASGISTTAASWSGAITVTLYVDEIGNDCYAVYQTQWRGRGMQEVIARGVIGQPALRQP